MAKRFTDNEKWKKQFFKGLSTVNKLFFLYILDECDNAGIWHVEPEIAELRIGEKLDLDLAKQELGKHIHEFDKGEKWFIPFFIDFQYGILNPSVNAHKSVIDKLSKRGLTKTYKQLMNCLSRDMDKDKDMDMVIDKDIKNVMPEFSEFLTYCKTLSIYHPSLDFQIEAKYNAWKENKWKDGNNKLIKNWKTKVQNTMPYFKTAYVKPEPTGRVINNDWKKVLAENEKKLKEQGVWDGKLT